MDSVGYFYILSTELCGQQKSCSLSLVRSLARSSLSTKVIVRACSLARYAELFNVISFSILSADSFFFRGGEREKTRENLYLYLYIYMTMPARNES